MRVERCSQWEEKGCVQMREGAIVSLIIHEDPVRVLFNFNSKLSLACRNYTTWVTKYWVHWTSFSEHQVWKVMYICVHYTLTSELPEPEE